MPVAARFRGRPGPGSPATNAAGRDPARNGRSLRGEPIAPRHAGPPSAIDRPRVRCRRQPSGDGRAVPAGARRDRRNAASSAAATRACSSCRRRAQQRAVGGVLHQRVLEQVGGVRSDAAAEQQSRHRRADPMRLAAPSQDAAPPARSVHRRTRGRAPRRFARSPWRAGPSRSRRAISEACNVAGTDSAASDVVASTAATRSPCAALSSTALVSSSTNSGTPSVRSTISATISAVSAALPASFCTSASPSRSPSRLSAKLVTWELTAPGRLKFGTKGDHQQHRQPPHPVDGQIQQLARGRVDPVGVLEHHQHRPAPRLGFELAEQRLEQLLPFALRAEVEVRGGTRQRQQLAQQRDIVVIPRARREQCPQFAELGFDRVVAGEPGGAFELRDEGIERAVLVVRRAEIAQARMRLAFDVLGKRRGQPRLADARLAGDQHHPPFAALRLLPAAQQQLDFLVAPDERRLPRAQGLEPAYLAALAQAPARRVAARQSRQVACGPRSSRSNSSPICWRVLSAMTSVFGVASACSRAARFGVSPTTAVLLRRALADQIADDDQPGGDADPHAAELRAPARRPTASITASPARTARSASSSCARG